MLHKRDTLPAVCERQGAWWWMNVVGVQSQLHCQVTKPSYDSMFNHRLWYGSWKKVSPLSDALCGGATFTTSTWTVSRLIIKRYLFQTGLRDGNVNHWTVFTNILLSATLLTLDLWPACCLSGSTSALLELKDLHSLCILHSFSNTAEP